VVMLRCPAQLLGQPRPSWQLWAQVGGVGPLLVLQVHPRFAMDRLRGLWTSQDRRPEEHTKASELAMAVMD
jgi:hypothetical protein